MERKIVDLEKLAAESESHTREIAARLEGAMDADQVQLWGESFVASGGKVPLDDPKPEE